MRVLIERIAWILLSLAGAFVLWYIFAHETEVAADVPVLVQFQNIPPDLELTSDPPERLFFKVHGPASRLTAEQIARTSLMVDLSNASGPGEQTVTIGARELQLPTGVSLDRVVPSYFRIVLDRRAERDVPVEVRYAGPPPTGYRIVQQRAVPPAVRIAGPEARVSRITSVSTDAINLSSTIGRADFRVPVWVDDPQVRFAQGPTMVTVQVQLEKIPQP
jgi:YbbR domain-containing protein